MSTEERTTVELDELIFISTTLHDFRGWLESYLKHKYPRIHLSGRFDRKYPDADILAYLNFGGEICIRVEHLSAQDLSLFVYATNIQVKDSHEVKIYLKNLQKDIVARWVNLTVENPSTNSNALTIFNELIQKVEQLTLEDAKISGKQLAKRIRSALKKYPEQNYLNEFNEVNNRFYSPHAGKNNLHNFLERDKRQTIGILEQILDEIQLGQDETLKPLDFVLEIRPLFGEPLSEDVQDWADVFVIMPFRDNFKDIYKNHIYKAVESENMSCAYGGEVDSVNAFITDVWSSIYHSKFCIAECTGNNPNVFYEIGIARTLGRQCILITQNDENEVPANLRHLKFIHYSPDRLVEFEDMLKKRIASVKRSTKQ